MKYQLSSLAVCLWLAACGSSAPSADADEQVEDTDTSNGDTDPPGGDEPAGGDEAADGDALPGDSAPSDHHPVATAVGVPAGSAVSLVIGAAGGTLASSDGRVALTVPAGALAADTTISITPIANEAHGGIGTAYRLEPDGQTFAQAATLTFGYTPGDLEGSGPEMLGAAFQTATGFWQWFGTPTLDTSASTVSIDTTHFTDVALVRGVTILPLRARVKTNASVNLSVLICYPRAVDPNDPELLANDCDVNVDDLAPYANVAEWSVNGVLTGNAANGTVSGNGFGVTYTAPSVLPQMNPVQVTARTSFGGLPPSLIVATITIEEDYPSYHGTVTFTAQNTYDFGEAEVTFTFWQRQAHSTIYLGEGLITADYQWRSHCDPVRASLPLYAAFSPQLNTFLEVRDLDHPDYPGTYRFTLVSEPTVMTMSCANPEPFETDQPFQLIAPLGFCGDQGFPVYSDPSILIGNRLCDPYWDEHGYEINYSIQR